MTASAPTLRLLPAPVVDPPYDDERPPASSVVDGSLALAFPPSGAGVPLRLVPPAVHDDEFEPQPTPRAQLPDPRPWTRRLAQVLGEIVAGARPAAQLARYATLDVLDQLAQSVSRHVAATRREPLLRPMVASVHVSEPADGVAEACAVLDTGPRRRALALRLEGIDGRWQCTALAFL
jgi:hypothetical protein